MTTAWTIRMDAHTICVSSAVGVIGFRSGCSLPALAHLIVVAEFDQNTPVVMAQLKPLRCHTTYVRSIWKRKEKEGRVGTEHERLLLWVATVGRLRLNDRPEKS